MEKMRSDWPPGFMSLLSIRGFIGLADGDYLQAIWITWLAWLVFLYRKRIKKGNNHGRIHP